MAPRHISGRPLAGAVLALLASGDAQAGAPKDWLGRWTGVVRERRGDFRTEALADIELAEAPTGGLVLIDHDRQRSGAAVPVAPQGRTFALRSGAGGNGRSPWTRGRLSADGATLTLTVRGAGMTRLETRTAVLHRDNPAARRFLAPRLTAEGRRATAYAYAAPAPRPDGLAVSTAAAEGVDPARLEALVRAILAEGDAPTDTRTESVLVLRNGRLILEEYFWGQRADRAHPISSVAKSVTSVIAGAAWDRGLLALDRPVAAYFPERTRSLWARQGLPVTVRHVLSMTSGTAWDDALPPPDNPSANLLATTDVVGYMLDRPPVAPPGSAYRYDNGLPSLIGPLVARVTSRPFAGFADDAVLRPMGIRNYRWTMLREGVPLAAGGAYMTSRDMAKLGQLMLDGGLWNGRRIISQAWVREATRQQTPPGQHPYGFYWHLSNDQQRRFGRYDAFMALGQGGQMIAVLPEARLVIVFTSSTWRAPPGAPAAWSERQGAPLDLIDRFLIPALP